MASALRTGPRSRWSPRASLAITGYKTGGATFIRMDPLNTFANQEQADDGVQGLFVAEIIEVLMDYRNIKNKKVSWHGNMSDGEGLSRVAAATLHPVGYYSALNGPFVHTWLKNGRGNWVTTTDPTDKTEDSFGCAILFIYYLRDQLNHSISAIIQKADDSLENTYQALAGSSGGFVPFKTLLDKYLPAGQMKDLVSDNPFPILEGPDRLVSLHFQEEQVSPPTSTVRRSPTVTVAPFFTCPAKTYHYRPRNLYNRLKCIATVSGFAQPKFTWLVNGLSASSGGSISPTVPIVVDEPQHPDAPSATTGQVRIYWNEISNTSSFDAMTGELDVSNPSNDHHGHERLTVQVSVSETFGSADVVTQTGFGTLDTKDVRYEQAFYDDRDRCLSAFHHKLDQYARVKAIPIVFTLPDPAPELRAAVHLLKEIVSELHAVTAKDPRFGAELARHVAAALQVPESMLKPTRG